MRQQSGWQQIADASTGMSAAQGTFWGRGDEPIAPPFPMADFGTGEMGAIAILHALFLRAWIGGSYHVKVSLCGFNNLVMAAGQYPDHVQRSLRATFINDFAASHINHASNFNKVGKAALDTMKRVNPQLWSTDFMTQSKSPCFGPPDKQQIGAVIQTQRGVVRCPAKSVDFCRSTRFNGFDEPSWESFTLDVFSH